MSVGDHKDKHFTLVRTLVIFSLKFFGGQILYPSLSLVGHFGIFKNRQQAKVLCSKVLFFSTKIIKSHKKMSELVSIVLLPQGRDAVRFRVSTSMSWQEFKDGARTRCGSSRLNEAEDLEFYVNNGLVKLVSTSDLVEGDKVLVVPAKQQQQDQGALPVSALTPFGRRHQHHHNRDRDTYLEVEGCVDVKEQQREFLRRGNSAGAE